jgi:hypothetical protein
MIEAIRLQSQPRYALPLYSICRAWHHLVAVNKSLNLFRFDVRLSASRAKRIISDSNSNSNLGTNRHSRLVSTASKRQAQVCL